MATEKGPIQRWGPREVAAKGHPPESGHAQGGQGTVSVRGQVQDGRDPSSERPEQSRTGLHFGGIIK
jgi:hypothetical protein